MSEKSDDFALRKALCIALLGSGVDRRDIRHEITLDTSSSGGRADVVALRDGSICGFELKSARDTLDRCASQRLAYEMAFDISILVVDQCYGPRGKDGFYDRERSAKLWQNHLVYADGSVVDWFSGCFTPLSSSRFRQSSTLSAQRMLRLLWASEVKQRFGASARHKGIRAAAETVAIREIRQGVVRSLRERELNKWECSFWRRFDFEASSTEVAA